MRRVTAVLLAIIFILSVPAAHAENGPVKKLGRGLANVVTCPFEIFKGMGDANAKDGIFAGLTWGVLKGTVDTVKRGVVGVYEMATFPVPIPADYDPILEDPEFFLEKKDYSGVTEKDWSYR